MSEKPTTCRAGDNKTLGVAASMSSTTAGFDEASRAHAAPLDNWSEATVGSVQSRDGTVIKYHRLGHGPGLVVLHGAMESAQSHSLLAKALADSFTVCVPDRREHTLGFPFSPERIFAIW